MSTLVPFNVLGIRAPQYPLSRDEHLITCGATYSAVERHAEIFGAAAMRSRCTFAGGFSELHLGREV